MSTMVSYMNEVKNENIRVLTLLKLDSHALFTRITEHYPEYIDILAMKRTREHIKDIYFTRFNGVSFKELILCGPEVMVELDKFYNKVFEMRWYLSYTEDMPNTMKDKIKYQIKDLSKIYNGLTLYLDAELNGVKEKLETEIEIPQVTNLPPEINDAENN